VRFERSDGRLVSLSDEAVSEYASEEEFEENRTESHIVLH
jgi:hypothetical protein